MWKSVESKYGQNGESTNPINVGTISQQFASMRHEWVSRQSREPGYTLTIREVTQPAWGRARVSCLVIRCLPDTGRTTLAMGFSCIAALGSGQQ